VRPVLIRKLHGGKAVLLCHHYNQDQVTHMAWRSSPEAPEGTMRRSHIGKPIFRLVACIATVFVATAVLYAVPLHDRSLTASFTFLIVVLIVSAFWGFRYAVFVSVLAALGFSWLLPPVGHFWLSDSHDVFSLAAFLVIGITAGRFSDRARREAWSANLRRAEAVAAQERFRDLVNSVEGIVWEADAATLTFLFVSDQAERILGYPTETWLNEPAFWKNHIHSDDRDRVVNSYEEAKAKKRNQDFECRMIAADGRMVWLRDLVTVVVENGHASRLHGVMIDITERKRAEQTRQELEEQWRAAFESNPTMYFIIDEAGGILSVNGYGAEQLGYTVSELVGQPVLNVFYEPDRQSVQGHANACFEQPGRMMRWEARKIRKDGTMLWVRETANAVILKKRPVLLVVCENITEQKRAEEAARRSESELRDLIDTIPTIAWVMLPDGSNYFTNKSWEEYSGISSEDTSGAGWKATFHPDDIATHVEKWLVSLSTGEPFENEARIQGASGEYRWFINRGVPLRDENGKILKWYGISTDIDDRKRAEALLTGEKRILEMVAKGDSLAQILDSLCRLVEEQASGVLASILLVDGDRLRHGGGPSLPKAFTDATDGVVIGPTVGSCGTAAYYGEQVIVEDIATDPFWANSSQAALAHSLRACWSTPIFSAQSKVIATFAMYYHEPRRPSLRDQEIIEQITHLAGVAIERKLTQEALRRSEGYLAESQRLTKTGSWAYNPFSGKTVYWSDEMFRIFELDPQDGPSTEKFWQLVHVEDLDRVKKRVDREAHDKKEYVDEYRITLPDGTIKHVLDIGHPILDSAGALVEFVGTTVDITERKRAEETLLRSEAYLAEAQRLSRTGSWAYKPGLTKPVYWSEEMYRIWGFHPDEGLPNNETAWQRIHPDDLKSLIQEQIDKASNGNWKTDIVQDHRMVLPDGTLKYLHAIAHPVFDETGNVVEYIGTSLDVTERKRAEEALRRSEAYLAEAQRLTRTGSFALDPNTLEPHYLSDEVIRMWGYNPEDGLPTRGQLLDRFHPADRDKAKEVTDKCRLNKTDAEDEFRIVLPDGRLKHIHRIIHAVLSATGEVVELIGTNVDVTEWKQAEENLRSAETRFRTYVDHATDVLFVHDEQGRIVDMNRQACESLGYTREELIGALPSLFDPNIHEISIQRIKERLEAGDLVTFESTSRRKDGTMFPVEVRVSPFLHGGHRFSLSLGRDISERKRAEQERERLRQIEEDLARINRVSMMGELTASLAHEIKQPIAASVSNAEACLQWLAHDQPDLVEVREAAIEMVKEARRAAEIMTRIRSLFKKEEITREVLDVNEVIIDTVSLVREEADRSSISVRTELDALLPRIAADRVQLQQVLLNLMLNGLEAMKGNGGELIIGSQQDEEGRALISVSDVGVGLPVGEGDKIFDAFFTTKPQGTGMGLAISRSIVESHGGRLLATANAGPGATFYFTLQNEGAEGA
jgi:PAS domain S-box-containing protein